MQHLLQRVLKVCWVVPNRVAASVLLCQAPFDEPVMHVGKPGSRQHAVEELLLYIHICG